VDVVYVSNHGGRALDHGPATLEVLPEIVTAVAGRAEVIVDGGFLRGSDVVKALALGAQAVMVGRATLYGACAAGEAGAARALEILKTELERAMKLCGAHNVAAIDSRLLFRK
jgi:isopentenyl diphosphate isomerase/L-lactate dehydrogenase-like FMN-dependent dehydrogenase